MAARTLLRAVGSFAVGVLAHQGVFIQGEWHLQAPHLVIAHLALALVPSFTRTYFEKGSYNVIHLDILGYFACYLTGLVASMAIYRLFFHRLRNFPGPRMAALTKVWHAWECRDSRNYAVLEKLRQQYGPFVRSGPEEITIFHPAGVEFLDGAGNHNTRTEWYDMLRPRMSTIFSRDERTHTKLRRVWTQALSTKSINSYLPRIKQQIVILESVIKRHENEPILLNDIMPFFAFDSMGDFVFNESYGMMESEEWHKAIIQQRSALGLLGFAHCTIWLIRLATVFVPFLSIIRDFAGMIVFCDKQMEKRLKETPSLPDIADHFIGEFEKNKETMSLAQRKNLLSGNAISAIVGGSDTTGPSLTLVWILLGRYPKYTEEIYEEISQYGEVDDASFLATLPKLNAFIDETMRLYPAAMTGGNRVTPPEGITVDNVFIPGNVKIAAPKWSIMRLESAFEKPNEFIPERWTTQPELVKDKRAFAPFGTGRRQCVGKNLALTQVRLVVYTVLKDFKVRLASEEDWVAVERDMRDQVTAQPGLCNAIFESRH